MSNLFSGSYIHSITNHSCRRNIEEHSKAIPVEERAVVEALASVIYPIDQYFRKHLFILTNDKGVVIHYFGSEEILKDFDGIDFGTGFSFAVPHLGVNAISLAMELHEMVCLTSAEHQLDLFCSLNCMCKPISVNQHIIGYLDLTVDAEIELTFAIPLLELLVNVLERYLSNNCKPCTKKQDVNSLFANIGFTKREQEVGRLWLLNYSAFSISRTLFISEGTVRNVIKRIYVKSGVGDKCSFIRKFLID